MLLRTWIDGVTLPKPSVDGGGLAPPMLMVQEYSRPNLLANVSLRPDGTVRLCQADESEAAPLPSLGSAIADASATNSDHGEDAQDNGNQGDNTPSLDKAAPGQGKDEGGRQPGARGSVTSKGTESNADGGGTTASRPSQQLSVNEADAGVAKSTGTSRPVTEGRQQQQQQQRQHTISEPDDAADDTQSSGMRSGAPSVTRSSDGQEPDFAAEEYSEEELQTRFVGHNRTDLFCRLCSQFLQWCHRTRAHPHP